MNKNKKTNSKFIIILKSLFCILCVSLIPMITFVSFDNKKQNTIVNKNVTKKKEYSSAFLQRVENDITEEDVKNIVLTVDRENVNVSKNDLFSKIIEYIEIYTGKSRNLGVVSNLYFNLDNVASYYKLYEKNVILVKINDKYIIRLPYSNHEIIIIDLTKEKYTDYRIFSDQSDNSINALKEMREYIIQEFNDVKNNENENNNADNIVDVKPNDSITENIKPESKNIIYGDANLDGKINSNDASVIMQYVEGMRTLGEQELKNADVNGDGKVNLVDARLIQEFVVEKHEGTLPEKQITDYVMYGDANLDGKINSNDASVIMQYVEGMRTLGEQELKNADVNGDGKVNLVDARLIQEFVVEKHEGTLPEKQITDYVMYGDANSDGKINSNDASVIMQYVEGMRTLGEQELKNADVNGDGKVNLVDARLIQEFVVRKHDGTLPEKQITDYVMYGDANSDGKINSNDASVIMQYVEGKRSLSEQELKNADVNGDGKVNLVDARLIQQFVVRKHEGTLPEKQITDYVMYGDANSDGKINSFDASVIMQYVEGKRALSEQELKNSDVNCDGKIDLVDARLIQEFVVKMHEGTLPENPIK